MMIKTPILPFIEENLANYLIDPEKLEGTITSKQVFGNNQPLHLEIGCGNGHFLTQRSPKFPNVNFIGLDRQANRVYKSIKKIYRSQIDNVRFLVGEAKELIVKHFADQSIQTCYLNFPDPWPKRRHHKNRLIKSEFLDMLTQKLEAKGFFIAVSDHEDYFFEILRLLEQDHRFENLYPQRYLHEDEDYEVSLFEERWRNLGRNIYYLKFGKK